jgi:transketolase
MNDIDDLSINTLRFLAVDATEAARSGHPGLPLGAAPVAYVLWYRFLKHNPREPKWFDRDRFVLSAGHGSALLYALIHTAGYDLPLEEIRRFRQWGSKTPGHPEYGLTPGIEATTGPLGQGFAMGVGMAIAERYLAHHFNRSGFPVIDHHTYAIVSDGDLMEGISHEAASLAGTLGLGKLIYLYDDNDISIEGSTDLTFTEDVAGRFTAYGWHVEHVADANDIGAVAGALRNAQAETRRPSLVIVRSHIGYGSPKQDSASAHGEPLGAEAASATKKKLGWPLEPTFQIPDEVREHFGRAAKRGEEAHEKWQHLFRAYTKSYPELARSLMQVMDGSLPTGWDDTIPVFGPADGPVATRNASGEVMNALAEKLETMIGGSADLAPSTKTLLKGYDDFGADGPGRNLRFGVREFAMGAIVNGMALHGGLIPYGSTFLVFSDYMRPALRLAAMMQAAGIFVFSHDSIALGEDGPTHQPVEQTMSLRAIPGLTVLRPADANETAACWRLALERRRPAAILLTRQRLPVLDPSSYHIEEGVPRGAYVLKDAEGDTAEVVLIATGSEVHLALRAHDILAARGIAARVVSMPSFEVFGEQPGAYREAILPPGIPCLAIEAGVTLGWQRYVGARGDVVGLDRFGASAPGEVVYERLGFTVESVVDKAMKLVRK